MSDWYRRSEWSDAAAADFEARLVRARSSSRAQYLSLQGYALIANHPQAAEGLLRRAIELAEPSEVPRAACYLALARVARGDVSGAIAAYDEAIEAEGRNPAFRSTAAVDQALLVALFQKGERYAEALDRLWLSNSDPFGLTSFEAAAAEALIRSARGEMERAQEEARNALSEMPEDAAEASWAGVSFADLKGRLEAIL